ncbi:MAG: hypothetical protein AAB456_03060 [Patescibacteria group bacterium]
MNEEIKKQISEAKNICLIPSENEPESLTAALALFYTLRDLGKNVNLIAEKFPEKISFLTPSLDFISRPQNLVISVPKKSADIPQIYYEKTENDLKIHLTLDNGKLAKEDVLFYYSEAKPDFVITLGIQDFQKQLENKMDSYGFLLGCPILNIDNNLENLKFGQNNLVETKSLAEIILDIFEISSLGKNSATCLLASVIMHYENFKSPKTNSGAFKISSDLMEKGAEYEKILKMSV